MFGRSQKATRSSARWFERALFLVAILALGYVGWNAIDRFFYQRIESARLARFVPSEPTAPAANTNTNLQPSIAVPELLIGPDGVIGRLTIPAAKVDVIVSEGVDDKTLRHAVGHIPQTALPGQPGNVSLAGHRDTFFRGLAKLKLEDPIQLITPVGTYDYVVEDLRVVEPTETQVLAPGPYPTLTLVTCYPFHYIGSAPQRYIVRAREVGRPAK